jgi:hypothetical protein
VKARALAVVLAVLALLVATTASAAPQLRTSITPGTIEVGGTATLSLSVTPGDQVSQAQLRTLPTGLSLVGQSVSPSFQITVVNGRMSQVVTARAVFQIRASREGTYTIGPPAVVSAGARLTGDRVTLKVVAQGTLPPQQQANPFDPFNFFGQGGPFQQLQPLDQVPNDMLEPSYPIDPRYNLDRPRAPGAFLHAIVDKTSAVVGEQVTLSVYLYVDVARGNPQFSDPHEAGASDFMRQSLIKDDTAIERSGFGRVGGRTYVVALLRKYALFPLHTGELEITPMRLTIDRKERASETLHVHVTEPPMDHRPPGYVVGDVGHFTISADVAPRKVPRGGAIAVNVELSGWGNLPSTLTVPARPGVTWLDPEVKDDLHVLDAKTAGDGVWGGTRRFAYVVTPTKEGDLDLGEMAVSFYDPREHAYGVARAPLGVVHVEPGAAPPAGSAKLLANMPRLRTQMGSTRGAEAHLDDSKVFWGLLFMPTALFGIAVSTRRAARSMSERARARKTSPAAELKARQRALDAAVGGDDPRAIDGAAIRVLEAGAEAHAGVNVRGVGGEEVAAVLTRAGVAADTAAKLRDLLDACAAARFSPDGAALDEARERADKARAVVARLAGGGAAGEGRQQEL